MYCVTFALYHTWHKKWWYCLSQKGRYFLDCQNAFEWSLYVTSLLFSIPFLFTCSFHWQWEAGALAIFLAWFNLLVILQRYASLSACPPASLPVCLPLCLLLCLSACFSAVSVCMYC